ncbi:MAG: hypothetical protein OD814_001681 [Candidatus Alkanophagales archaeon MCA70_species_1]|nr:hypothetical protein [Candidatus Alkanophaga volatiphilum]
MDKQKIMASVVIAAIVIAGAIIAVAKNSKGEGFINPKAIMPGAITTEHLADGAVTGRKIASDAVTTTKIRNRAVNDVDLNENAIPCEVNYTNTEVTVTGTTETEIINKKIKLRRDSRLIIIYTINDSWAEPGNAPILNCTVFNETGAFAASAYPDDVLLSVQNLSTTITFYTDVVDAVYPGDWFNVSIRLKSNSTGTVGIKEQALTVIALPAEGD